MPRVTKHANYFSDQVTRTRRFYHTAWRKLTANERQLAVVGGGCEWCAPNFIIDRERFPFLAFEFVWQGRGHVQLGSKKHRITPGMAFFFDASVAHVIRSEAAAPMVKYFFNFSGAHAQAVFEELKLRPGTVFRVGDPARLAELLDEAIDHALKGTPLGVRASAAVLEHALVVCAEGRHPSNVQTSLAFGTYLKCRNFLLRNYPVLSSVSNAARACQVSVAYLTRLFQRFDQETPHACLTRLKMTQALQKLRQPGVAAKTVAVELGFKSAAHFSRAFKRHHGRTPKSARAWS
jgi:AraC-like DNA-binding protein